MLSGPMPDRPQDMYTRDREPVPAFDPEEVFYVRVHPSTIQPENTVDPVHVPCPDLSSNRSGFSQPWYVLYPTENYGGWAVFMFRVQEVLPAVSSINPGGGEPVVYDVMTAHDPEVDNFAHCETRLYRGAERMAPNKVSKGAKKVFREHMSRILQLNRAAGEPV